MSEHDDTPRPDERPAAHPTEPIERPEELPLDSPARAVAPNRPAPPAPTQPAVPTQPPPPTEPLPPPPATPTEPVAAREELPDLDDITFSPRDEAPPAVVAPRKPRAREAPAGTALPASRYRTLAAFADALLPPGGTIVESASEAGVVERVDGLLRGFDPAARRAVERALRTIEWSSAVGRSARPFSRLGSATATAEAGRARASRIASRRRAAETVATLVADTFASTPLVEEVVGFTYGCATEGPTLDVAPLEVLSWPQIARDHVEECDVVVIGSGAGGAVMARELADLGHQVIVIEEGGTFTRRDAAGPPAERSLRLMRPAATTVARGAPDVALGVGWGVGGSTLASAGSAFRAPDAALARWEKDGIPGVDPAGMAPFFERVERAMRVQPTPEDLVGAGARAFARGAAAMDVRGALVTRMIEGCRGCGVCTAGCPTDAKLSTAHTYLPRAQRNGATIYAHARAERILVEGGRARGVVASLVDARTREPRATLTVRAKLVVLAAGALHTPALLLNSALGNGTGLVGRGLRVQPFAAVAGVFAEEIRDWVGTQQPYAIDDWLESHHVLVEYAAAVPSLVAHRFDGAGVPLKEMIARLGSIGMANVTVADTSEGTVGRDGSVRYRLNEPDARRLVRGIANCAEVFLRAGARTVYTGLPGVDPVSKVDQLRGLDEERVRPAALRLEAHSPMGTARMGPDPARSVVGPWGEVHGVAGLFVADASVVPGPLGVPPQITVMALATRAADHIQRNAGSYF